MDFQFKHLDLQEIEGRLSPTGKSQSARGKMYWDTTPGRNDTITRYAALILKEFWSADPDREIRLNDIEAHRGFPKVASYSPAALLPAAVKRLARIKQVKIDFDREGVIIRPGAAWIET